MKIKFDNTYDVINAQLCVKRRRTIKEDDDGAITVTLGVREITYNPATFVRALIAASADKKPLTELPYVKGDGDLPESMQDWICALTDDNHPQKVKYGCGKTLLAKMDELKVDLWKYDADKVAAIRECFTIKKHTTTADQPNIDFSEVE